MRLMECKGFISVFLFLFVFIPKINGQVVTSGSAYVWSTTTSWTPTGVPASTSTVTVNSPLTLDQNLTISTGAYTFNSDVTDQPGGTNYGFTASSATGSITIASGTTTIGGVTDISGGASTNFTLTVKNGATLVLGTLGSNSNNFLIGNKVNITVELGGTLIVYGNVVDSDSSGTININGLLQVYGNYSTDNGNINISGTGQFFTTGSMSTQGSSNIYGSSNDCTSNCSGTSLGCGNGTTAYTATITPQSQTICSGGTVSTLTFSTNAPSPNTYSWEYSSSAGGTYATTGVTTSTYTTSGLTATTWYRVKYTSSSSNCSGNNYSAPIPVYVSASTYTQSTSGQTVCSSGTFGPISVSAYGTGLTYQWYSNTSASNSGGTLISGATSNIYTPSSATVGTTYYYCTINSSSCPSFYYTTAVSGAFTVYSAPTITGTTPSSRCSTGTVTLGATASAGTINWYANSTGGSSLGTGASFTTPSISSTTTYYVDATLSGCTTASRTAVTATVNSLPVAAGTITGTATVCQGQSGVSYSVPAITNASSYTWSYSGTGVTITNGTTNTPTIAFASNATSGNLTVYGVNSCGNGTVSSNYAITVNSLSIVPTTVTGVTTICNGETTTLTVSGGTLGTGAIIEWFTGSCNGTSVGTGNSITVSPTSNTTYYVRYNGTCNTTSCISQLVTVNALPDNVSNGFSATIMCAGGSPQLTFDADNTTFSTPYTITYQNDTTLNQYTVTIPSASAYSFTPGDNPTSNATYTLVSISNASCTRTSGFIDPGASLIVRPIPNATINGTTSVCVGDTSPNITFTNPQTVAVTVTYNINGGANQTVNLAASGSSNIAVATTTSGVFVYNLVSVIYQSTPNCSNTLSGSATVTVNPNLPASVTITASPSGAICTGTSVTFTATPTNGGTTPSYQWKLNGSNVGVNSNTYSNSSLTVGDLVSCEMTSNATPCLTGSPSTSNIVTMVVNPIPAAPIVGTITHPTCAVTTGSFTITNYDASYTYTVSPSVGGSVSGSLVTAPSGSYTITADALGCTSANSNFTINAQPVTPSAPVVGTITQPNCTLDTGSVELTGLPSGTWTLTRSGTSTSTTTGTGSSVIISGLADGGSFTFTVSNGICTSVASNAVNIDAISTMTSTWNGSAWVNGPPDSSKRIVFAGNFSSTDNITGCSCKVSPGANVIINSAHTLTVTNGIDVQANGSLTFENNASLVQINDVAINTGTINYKRYTTPVRRYDFTYWSSPVAGQTLKNLSPLTLFDKYYGYDPNSGWVIYYNGAVTMQIGYGYSVRAPQTFDITTATVDTSPVFIGVPNNGVVNRMLLTNKWYLLGNPYPSAIDANSFLDVNSNVLEGTLYFWTHNTAPSTNISGTAVYNYSPDDYATYNRTGTVSTATKAGSGGNLPSGKIAAGQGFFAPSSSSGGVLTFNNSMRVDGGNSGVNNSQFFKFNTNEKLISPSQIEKSRIWLNLANKEGVLKQILIGYLKGATNEYDRGFDGSVLKMNREVDFYSVNQGLNLVIQGRALPFDNKDVVVLGYQSANKDNYQISIDQTDGFFDSQDIFLEDNYLNVVHDLKKGPYSFVTEKGTFNNRFALRYTDKKTEISSLGTKIFVSVKANTIKLNSTTVISKVKIYNVLGQLIYQNDKINLKDFLIENLNLEHQVLIVKVVLANEEIDTVKIVY